MPGLTLEQVLQNADVVAAMEKAFGEEKIREVKAQNVSAKTVITQLEGMSQDRLLQAMSYLTALLCSEILLESSYLDQLEADDFMATLALLSTTDQIKVMKKIPAQEAFKLRSSRSVDSEAEVAPKTAPF